MAKWQELLMRRETPSPASLFDSSEGGELLGRISGARNALSLFTVIERLKIDTKSYLQMDGTSFQRESPG